MKRKLRIGARSLVVEIDRRGKTPSFRIDGQPIEADVAEISPGVYSLLLGGRSFEARVDPKGSGHLEIEMGGRRIVVELVGSRASAGERGGGELEGRQQITAPMPGKVVRTLMTEGQQVEAGQGILVLEAMKMQNEVRSPKSGALERLLVTEGQTVNSGDLLAIVS